MLRESAGVSRRQFVRGAAGFVAAGLLGGTFLRESGAPVEHADYGELWRFLSQPTESPELGQKTSELLSFVGVDRPCDVRWVHRADTVSELDKFFNSSLHMAEIDFRYDPDRGLYIGHDRGDRTRANVEFINDRLVIAEPPKTIKYDCKDRASIEEVIVSAKPDRPCILNAGIYGSPHYQLDPQGFVDSVHDHDLVVLSPGRNLRIPGYSEEMLSSLCKLVQNNPEHDFTVPVHIHELMVGIDPFIPLLELPSVTLTVFRTRGYDLTQGHVRWLKENLNDHIRAKTFFDL